MFSKILETVHLKSANLSSNIIPRGCNNNFTIFLKTKHATCNMHVYSPTEDLHSQECDK